MESKTENPTFSFKETNLVLQLISESQIKSKTVMSWSSLKKKRGHFLYRLFFPKGIFLKIFVLSQCIVYWIHFQNIYTFTYQKTLFHTLLSLVFKIVESLQCILKLILVFDKFLVFRTIGNVITKKMKNETYITWILIAGAQRN